MPPRLPSDLLGTRFGDRFRADRVVAEGFRSHVLEGWDEERRVPVAIKCAAEPGDPELGAALAERIASEARATARVGELSSGVVRHLGHGVHEDASGASTAWAAFEWVDGQALADELWLRRLRGGRGQGADKVMSLLAPVFDALSHAHALGIVHADLGPRSIFLAQDHAAQPRAVLASFGASPLPLAAARRTAPESEATARMAPEQLDPSIGAVCPATDVMALALVVIEMLADMPPFTGDHPEEIAEAILDRTRRPTPRALGVSCGDALEHVLSDALELDPAARPRNAAVLRASLLDAIAEDAAHATTSEARIVAAEALKGDAALRALDSLPMLRVPYPEVAIRTISALPPPRRTEEAQRATRASRPAAWLAVALGALAIAAWLVLRAMAG